MNISCFIKSKLDLTFLCLFYSLSNIKSYSSSLWRWHQSFRTKLLSNRSQFSNKFRSSNQYIKICLSSLDISKQIFVSSNICTNLSCFISLIFSNENSNFLSLSCSVRKDCCSSKHLIIILWISVSFYCQFNTSIKLSIIYLSQKLNCFSQRVKFSLFYEFFYFYVLLSVFHNNIR